MFLDPKFFSDPKFFWTQNFVRSQKFLDPKFFQTQNFFLPKINFNENDLLRDKTEVLNLRLSKLPSANVLLKLEFDTEDQVLLVMLFDFQWLSY